VRLRALRASAELVRVEHLLQPLHRRLERVRVHLEPGRDPEDAEEHGRARPVRAARGAATRAGRISPHASQKNLCSADAPNGAAQAQHSVGGRASAASAANPRAPSAR